MNIEKLKKKIKRIPKTTKCPYCGKKTVSFFIRLRACNRLYSAKCRECEAQILMSRRYFIHKWVFLLASFAIFVIINYTTHMYRYAWFKFWPYFSLIAVELYGAVFGRVDYEATSKHLKPSPLLVKNKKTGK